MKEIRNFNEFKLRVLNADWTDSSRSDAALFGTLDLHESV